MDRLWKATFVLGLLLAFTWWQASAGRVPALAPPRDAWVFVAALVVLAFTGFALVGRTTSYVRPFPGFLRIVTPFLRLNVSYQRVRSVHPVEFHRLFPPRQTGWATRRLLSPFYGQTVVVVELFEYPLSRGILRLFLAPQMFYPKGKGFVLVVPEWMSLSTEIDSFRGEWQQSRKPPRRGRGMFRA